MLESRKNYGYGNTIKNDTEKWMVAYKTKDGNYGEVGYLGSFKNELDARKEGEQYKAKHSWVKEIIIKHPNSFSSGY